MSLGIPVLLMPLLATAGVFLDLWITGTELNIAAMMGMTMIIGIVTEIAIFYFSEYFLLRGEAWAEIGRCSGPAETGCVQSS